MSRALVVLDPDPLTAVQDLGRRGWAHLGVPRSGVLDAPVARTPTGSSAAPTTPPGLEDHPRRGGPRGHRRDEPGGDRRPRGGLRRLTPRTRLRGAGDRARRAAGRGRTGPVGAALLHRGGRGGRARGARLAVHGHPLRARPPTRSPPGATAPVGPRPGEPQGVDVPAVRRHDPAVLLRLTAGPRHDWYTDDALATLGGAAYTVSAVSNRIGLRLHGARLARRSGDELPSRDRPGRGAGPGVGGAAGVPQRPPHDRRLPRGGRGGAGGPAAV